MRAVLPDGHPSAADPEPVAVYEGTVRHTRRSPTHHHFSYRVYMTWLDLDDGPDALDRLPGWSARRWAPSQLRATDHLDGAEQPLADGVRDLVADRLGRRPDGRVTMLTNLRTWGWVFNPLTVYWCFDADGEPTATVLEVTNTPWGERTHHVLDASGGASTHLVAKDLHVSPFLGRDLRYRVRAPHPGRSASIRIEVLDGDDVVLDTSLAARRHRLTRRRAVGVLLRHPLITQRVSLGIHVQAARLWRKRIPVVAHRPPDARPAPAVTTSSHTPNRSTDRKDLAA